MWILLEKSRQQFLGLFVHKMGNEQEKSPQILSWNGSQSPKIPFSHISLCDQAGVFLAISGIFLAIPLPILLSRDVELFLFFVHPVLSHGSNISFVLGICFPVQQFLHFRLDKPDFL